MTIKRCRQVVELAGWRGEVGSGAGEWDYASTKFTNDADNLRFGLDEVCDCLCALQDGEFSHSGRYRANGLWHDVYKTYWGPSGHRLDAIYVNFRLDGDLQHAHRWCLCKYFGYNVMIRIEYCHYG